METATHRKLKQLAVAFLREQGCRAVASEVRCPISRYRVDVAGYLDAAGGPRCGTGRRRPDIRTVLIECKQTRQDFFRDRRDRERLLAMRRDLDRFRRVLEDDRIRTEEPDLRRAGTSLFPELEEWDFTSSRLPAYRDVLRRLRRIDRMLHGRTKFCMVARYGLADRLYLAAPQGLLRERELPPGWGLLECPRRALRDRDPNADLFGESVLRVTVRSGDHHPRSEFRQRLLRNIAVAASTAASRAMGILAEDGVRS